MTHFSINLASDDTEDSRRSTYAIGSEYFGFGDVLQVAPKGLTSTSVTGISAHPFCALCAPGLRRVQTTITEFVKIPTASI